MEPELIGPYEILAPLGSGGMGDVFLARDIRLDRSVAIKRIRTLDDPEAERRLAREARTVAHLSHPNIASLFDVVQHAGNLHLVMEYVEGETLAARLRRGRLSEPDALECSRQIADALSYAHGQGILHCDIKPSNVIVTPQGRAKVLDFGIARLEATLRDDGEQTTTANVLQGTPPYMAPEVRSGATPSPRSDVYSIGVLMFELLAGHRPYDEGGGAARAHSPTPEARLHDSLPDVSRGLSRIVSCALALDPSTRFGSAAELKVALDTLATGVSHHRPKPVAVRLRWLVPTVLLTLVCAALLVGLIRGARSGWRTDPPSVIGIMIANRTGDDSNEYLAAGLSDVMAQHLSNARSVAIVPRSALTPYFGKVDQTRNAIRDLGLTHLLTGGIQRAGPQIRLTVSLLAGADQTVLWSSALDGAATDFLHFEQRAADGVLKALRARNLIEPAAVSQARARPLTTNPDALDAYSHGRALFERADVTGNLERALALFEQATRYDARFVRAHSAMGEAAWLKYRVSKDAVWVDRARAALLEALRLDAEDPSVRFALAVVEHGTGRVDDAVENLEQVIAQQPASDEAHRLLGRIYSERREFPKAIEEFREALRIRPEFPTTVRALGLAYFDEGKSDEAIAAFTKLTTLQPDSAPSFQLLGTALHSAGALDRALVAYERANALAPRPRAYSNIGVIHHTRGDYAGAVAAYRKAIALQPKEATTRRNLADALWMTGDVQAARTEYEQAILLATDGLRVNPAEARDHALIAFCEAKLGRFAQARQRLAEALRLAPNDSEVVYKQAVIQALAGDRTAAVTTLRRALELGYSASRLDADRDLDSLRALPEFPKTKP